jgi:hypothetical protein
MSPMRKPLRVIENVLIRLSVNCFVYRDVRQPDVPKFFHNFGPPSLLFLKTDTIAFNIHFILSHKIKYFKNDLHNGSSDSKITMTAAHDRYVNRLTNENIRLHKENMALSETIREMADSALERTRAFMSATLAVVFWYMISVLFFIDFFFYTKTYPETNNEAFVNTYIINDYNLYNYTPQVTQFFNFSY